MTVRRAARDIVWGARRGLLWGFAIATLGVLRLATLPRGRRSDDLLISMGVLGLFLVAGPVSGAIFGALRPWANGRARAILVGSIAALPSVYVVLAVVIGNPRGWRAAEWISCGLSAAMLGAYIGHSYAESPLRDYIEAPTSTLRTVSPAKPPPPEA
jgi:hypothetical protein